MVGASLYDKDIEPVFELYIEQNPQFPVDATGFSRYRDGISDMIPYVRVWIFQIQVVPRTCMFALD